MSRSYSIYNSTNTYVKTSWEGYDKAMCFGGDTYLGVLDYTHTMLFTRNDPDDRNGFKRYVGAYIPLESSINLYYRMMNIILKTQQNHLEMVKLVKLMFTS